MRLAMLALALSFACTTVPAKIYKWVLPDGSVVYSDRPREEGAQQLELPPLQTYTPAPTPDPGASGSGTQGASGNFPGYSSFEVLSPGADETVRDNAGTVEVQIGIDPQLQAGHEIEIFVDGSLVGAGRGTRISLTGVDRGSHAVHAVVKDESGNEVGRTDSITFHMKQVSRLLPPRRPGPNPGPPPPAGGGAPAS